MQYLDQATDFELSEFIEAVQKSEMPYSSFQEHQHAYRRWRATHAERYMKIQQMYPEKLRRYPGRPRKKTQRLTCT